MTLRSKCIACKFNKKLEEFARNSRSRNVPANLCHTKQTLVKLNKKSFIKGSQQNSSCSKTNTSNLSRRSSATTTISTTTAPSNTCSSPYLARNDKQYSPINYALEMPTSDITLSCLTLSENRAMYEQYRKLMAQINDKTTVKSKKQGKREASQGPVIDESIYLLQQFRMQNLDLCFNQQRQAQLRFFGEKEPPVFEEQYCSICERCMDNIKEIETSTSLKSNLLSLIPTTVRQKFEEIKNEARTGVKRSSHKLSIYGAIGNSPALRFQETYG